MVDRKTSLSSPLWRVKAAARKAISALFVFLLICAGVVGAAEAESGPQKRIAFVVGNAAYKAGALPTTANDAGLIAQTLQAAGFDVIGARDLDHNGLSDAMRDFLAKASASGPDTVVFVYLSGYGLQYQGDNYFLPVDAAIANATDVPIDALRVSDFTKSLAALNNRGSIVVLDAARTYPFPQSGAPQLAGGLALVDPDANQLIAFNAAPGTVAPQEAGPYGSYAHALAEMIRAGGLPLGDVFDRARLRVSDLTKGAEISWDVSKFTAPFTFFERAADAPAAPAASYDSAAIRTKAIGDFQEKDAYFAALDRDTLSGYEDFLAAYPNDAMAKRVRAIVAARREAITWRETWRADTPEAYWSYLRRYPRGPHVWDARRRLTHFEAALEPPPSFTMIAYDVPPPPPPEVVYVERPVLSFDEADFGYAPPPPVVFLPPPPPDFVVLAPPPPPVEVYVLPVPVFVPVPRWVEPPRNVAPPENNIIFNNIHSTVVNNVTVSDTTVNAPQASPTASGLTPGLTAGQKLAGAAVLGAAGAAALHIALPPSVQKKALLNPGKAAASAASGVAAVPAKPVAGSAAAHALPGLVGTPPAGQLPKTPKVAPTNKAQPPLPSAATAKAAAQPAPKGAKAQAAAVSSGKPLPLVSGPHQTKGQKRMAKAAAPSLKPRTVAGAPSFTPHQAMKLAPRPAFARAPAKAPTATVRRPPASLQPRVAAPMKAHAPPAQLRPQTQPKAAPQIRAPQVRAAPQIKAPPQAKAPPQVKAPQQVKAAPHGPQPKKPCGAPGLPACHG